MPSNRAMALRTRSANNRPGLQTFTYGSYRATGQDRARNINRDGSGDRHADDYSRRLARELARDQDRSNGIYRMLVTTFLDLVVGAGVMPMPKSKDLEWNKKAYDYFLSRCDKLDQEGVDTYGSLQRKWVRAVINDGDILTVKIAGVKISTVEADRIDGRLTGNQHVRVHGGIQYRVATGERIAYGVAPYDANGNYVQADRAQWFPTEQVVFCGTPSRKSQMRSLPALVAVLDDSERADSLIESEIISAEQASTIWGWIKDATGNTSGNAIDPIANLNADGTAALGGVSTAGSGASNITYQDFTAGLLGFLGNRDFQQAQTSRPNLNVPEFVRVLMRIFAAELGVPVEMALLDVGRLSWSANKSLLAYCEQRLKVWRGQVFGPLFSQIYRFVIGDAIKRNLLPEVADWENHEHFWPKPPEADGPDQVTTDEGNLRIGRTSLHRVVGPEWEQVLREQGAEQRVRDEENVSRVVAVHKQIKALKASDPDLADLKLTWQQIVTLGGATSAPGAYLAAAATTAQTTEPDGDEEDDDEKDEAQEKQDEAKKELAAAIARLSRPLKIARNRDGTLTVTEASP